MTFQRSLCGQLRGEANALYCVEIMQQYTTTVWETVPVHIISIFGEAVYWDCERIENSPNLSSIIIIILSLPHQTQMHACTHRTQCWVKQFLQCHNNRTDQENSQIRQWNESKWICGQHYGTNTMTAAAYPNHFSVKMNDVNIKLWKRLLRFPWLTQWIKMDPRPKPLYWH